jgi:hypothetical protein
MAEPAAEAQPTTSADRAAAKAATVNRPAPELPGNPGKVEGRIQQPSPARAEAAAQSKESLYHHEITILRKEVVRGATTGEAINVDRRGFAPNERAQPSPDRAITINADTVQQYAMGLETLVETYGHMAHEDSPDPKYRNKLEYVLSDPSKKSEKLLIDAIAGTPTLDSKGTPSGVSANPAKVMEILQTGEGWSAATIAMERFAIMAQLGEGVRSKLNMQYYREHFGENPNGKSRTFIMDQDPTARRIAHEVYSKAATVAGAGLYWAVGSGRETLDLPQDIGMIMSLKQDLIDKPTDSPEEKARKGKDRAYFSGVLGIDLDKIRITGGGKDVQIRAEHGAFRQDNVAIDRTIAQFTNARNSFLEQLAVDENPTRIDGWKKINRSRKIRSQGELEALPMEYKALVKAELVSNGSSYGTEYRRLRQIADAEGKVMAGILQRRSEQELVKKDAGEIGEIQRKRDLLASNPDEYFKQQKEEADKKKEEATNARAEAQARKDALSNGPDSPMARRAAIVAKEQALQREGVSFVGDVDANAKLKIKELEERIKTARASKIDAEGELQGVLVEYNNRIMDLIANQNAAVNNMADAVRSRNTNNGNIGNVNINTINPDQFRQMMDAIGRVSHQSEIDEWNEELTTAKVELDRVRAAYREYEQVQAEEGNLILGIAVKENGDLLYRTDNALDDFIDAGVSDDDIRDLPADELAKQLLPAGADEKEQAKALQKALSAKAEYAALQDEIASPLPLGQVEALMNVVNAGITEDDLVTRGTRELTERLVTAGMPEDEIDHNLQEARLAAGRMFMTRFTGRIDQEVEYYDGVIEAQDDTLKEIGDPKTLLAEYDVAIGIMKDSGGVYSRFNALLDPGKKAERDALLDGNAIASDDESYSEAERSKGVSRGYVEAFHRLYPGAKLAPNRNDMFEGFYRAVPPKKLAELYFGSYGLVTIPDTLGEALDNMKMYADDWTVSTTQSMAREILIYTKKRTAAL